MPATQRQSDTCVIERLRDAPQQFDFFQAVRILARHFQKYEPNTDRVVGERIRFGNSLNMGFAPSDIESLDFKYETDDADPVIWPAQAPDPRVEDIRGARIVPSFIGISGLHGTLPLVYTEKLIYQEIIGRDKVARAFLDVFTNRIVTLFFKAWGKYRLHFQYESNRRERFLPIVLSMLGVEGNTMQNAVCNTDNMVLAETLAFYGGGLRQSAHSAQMIERILSDYFKIPVLLRQFVGRWHNLPISQTSSLGMANMTLGKDIVCGSRMWQCQTSIAVELGPLDRTEFDRFLPGGKASRTLRNLLFALTGITLDCTVRLILRRQDVRTAGLGAESGNARLGYNTWVLSRLTHEDRKDVTYEITPSCFTTA